jgi:hypothetical protein
MASSDGVQVDMRKRKARVETQDFLKVYNSLGRGRIK